MGQPDKSNDSLITRVNLHRNTDFLIAGNQMGLPYGINDSFAGENEMGVPHGNSTVLQGKMERKINRFSFH